MREILFRGKSVYDNKWVQGDLNHYHTGSGVFIAKREEGDFCERVIPETVGQYTGLTDKNGKKIFEGDIVKTNNLFYVCFWDDCNFEFGLKNNKEDFGIAYAPHDIEVIGNIHDNPELLGGGAK